MTGVVQPNDPGGSLIKNGFQEKKGVIQEKGVSGSERSMLRLVQAEPLASGSRSLPNNSRSLLSSNKTTKHLNYGYCI